MVKKPTVKELQQKIDELTEALKRERADAINIRRRHEEHNKELQNIIKSRVVKELLPVIDSFERALSHIPKDLEKNDYVKGVQAIVKQFEKALEDMGVKRISTVGGPFDPHLHEAVSVEGEGSKETVSEELQAGYTLGNEVIRHAIVKVKTS
ncbi:MAG TPA: nucleotide exchange factor GrpE [Candidatus Saccharimonadales bacterium]|nr:nucleotide exchange factor GrpE [Candidatus Saccharimonadales bacterium]